MVKTWATDGTALAELIESPDATGTRFDLDPGAVEALRDADRFAPDPTRRRVVRRTPAAATISFDTGSTITGGSSLTFDTGSTITGGSSLTFDTGSTITGGSSLTFDTGSTVTGNPSPR